MYITVVDLEGVREEGSLEPPLRDKINSFGYNFQKNQEKINNQVKLTNQTPFVSNLSSNQESLDQPLMYISICVQNDIKKNWDQNEFGQIENPSSGIGEKNCH